MNTLTIVLRLLHIFSGVFWAGTTFIFYFVIGPAINGSGDTGPKFAAYLITKAHFTRIVASAAGLTVLAGVALYLVDSSWFTSAWMNSGAGTGFAIGGAAGIVAFIFGILFGRNNEKLVELGSKMQGPPSPEQLAAIQAVQKNQRVVGLVMITAMIIAVGFMAGSRYLRL